MKAKVFDQGGKELTETLLPKEIFGLEMNEDLVHQVVRSQMGNRRPVLAHTKDRSEVRGGGKKPWRQKGTGRARHGSIRSPLWRHGGVTFGPTKERNFKKRIPKKMNRLALLMVLSAKAKNGLIVLLDSLKLATPKTKVASVLLSKLPLQEKKTLVVLPERDQNVILAVRNMAWAKTIQAKDLNALDLLSVKYLVMPKNSIKVIKETFVK